MEPAIRVRNDDVLAHRCDVLVVKYAQSHFGVDEAVAGALSEHGQEAAAMRPPPGACRVLESRGAVAAKFVMFLGVEPLSRFGYRQIRVFAREALQELAGRDLGIGRIALTAHGAGYGLDEKEAFESLMAGLTDAIGSGNVPSRLTEIAVVERNAGRAERLAGYLAEFQSAHPRAGGGANLETPEAQKRLREVGYASETKPHVFVAMPFTDAKTDYFHYGIQRAVNAAGYLCERIDITAFTGDIVERIKERIATAELVVADLSGGNPNVFLEVGYAWGRDIPTVLISDDVEDLRFDVKGQRCLIYKNIRDLEARLAAELIELRHPLA